MRGSSLTRFLVLIALVGSLLASEALARAGSLPKRIGECRETRITQITTRLMDGTTRRPIRDSGSAVSFSNGGYQVSYEEEEAISRSRVGDRVLMCLVTVPEDCPPGDDRGRRYTTTNLRTGGSWTLPDSPHSCGGA
jgi:hypothetical protein